MSASAPHGVAGLVALQQSAGNAAVTRMLAATANPAARASALWDRERGPAARELRRIARRADEAARLAGSGSADPRATAYRAGHAHANARLGIYREGDGGGGTATAMPTAPVATTKARAVGVQDAVDTIVMALAMPNIESHKEEILRAILDIGEQRVQLPAAYEAQEKRPLEQALKDALTTHDWFRARAYLRHGTLRPAEKIVFASDGLATDEDTLYRVMREAHGDFVNTEAALKQDYSDTYRTDKTLFHLSDASRIAGILADELSGPELDKARATLAFGLPRPIDEIAIAMNGAGTDEDMLYRALQGGGSTLREQWGQYYGGQDGWEQKLDDALDSDLDGDDLKKAIAILDGKWDVRWEIEWACSGPATDEEAIWKALGMLTPAERGVFRQEWDAQGGIWHVLDGDLDAEDMKRAQALIYGAGGAQARLEQAGAFDGPDIVDTIKMASPEAFAEYRREYEDARSSLRSWVDERTTAIQEGHLHTILFGSTEERIRWAIGTFNTDEDYLFHLLGSLDDAGKQAVSGNSGLMSSLQSGLSTSEYNRALDTLRPGNLSLEQQAAATGEQVEREKSVLTELFSNSSDALADEQRGLESALLKARVDGQLSPEEQQQIASQHASTQEALAAYVQARDAIEDLAANILTTAAAVVVSICTAGAGSGVGAAMVASQLAAQAARVALISAVARVLATKVARGDRFDVIGADGAIAFAAGAVDGVLNVFGGKIAQSMINPAFRAAASVEAKAVAVQAWQQALGRRMIQTAVEGGVGGGVGAAFETTVNEPTWKGGFEAGFTNVATAGGMGVLQGAGMAVGVGSAGEAIGAIGKGGPAGTHMPPAHGTPDAATGTPHTPGDGAAPHTPGEAPEVKPGDPNRSADPTLVGPGTGAVKPSQTPGAVTAALSSAPPALVAALPSHLQGRVPILIDPKMSSLTGVRVHYDIDADGLVTGIHMRVGPQAGATEIGLHVRTVESMQKYSGVAGRLRALLRRFNEIVGINGAPEPGTRAFEAKLEVDKLPAVIEQKMRLLQDGGLDTSAEPALAAEIADLERQLVDFQKTVEEMDLSAGRGFVAADARDPGLQTAADALKCGQPMKDALARKVNVELANRLRADLDEMFVAVKAGELDEESARVIIRNLGGFAKGEKTLERAEAQFHNVLAELHNARRVAGDLAPGHAAKISPAEAVDANGKPVAFAPVIDPDTFYVTKDGKVHIDEVKGTASALVQKLREESKQLDRLRRWRDGGPDRAAEVVIDTDEGWTKIFGETVMEDDPTRPGKQRTVQGSPHGLTIVIESTLTLRIGGRVFTSAEADALNKAIAADMGASGVGSAKNVADGTATMTYGEYFTTCIPTLAATAARLGAAMPGKIDR